MIYLDTSVALAHLLGETRVPPVSLWDESLVSSRLLEYELRVRLNARGLAKSHEEHARALADRVALIELSPVVLGRALEPFPVPVRTLDALHLATLEYLRSRGTRVALATYDERLRTGAVALGIELSEAAG